MTFLPLHHNFNHDTEPSQPANIHHAQLNLVRRTRRQLPGPHDQQFCWIIQHPQMARICVLLGRGHPPPRGPRLCEASVNVHIPGAVGTRNDSPVLPTHRTPNHIWRTRGNVPIRCLEHRACGRPELFWVRNDLEEDWELISGQDFASTVLIRHEELAIGQPRDGWHTWALGVCRVGDVVNNGTP